MRRGELRGRVGDHQVLARNDVQPLDTHGGRHDGQADANASRTLVLTPAHTQGHHQLTPRDREQGEVGDEPHHLDSRDVADRPDLGGGMAADDRESCLGERAWMTGQISSTNHRRPSPFGACINPPRKSRSGGRGRTDRGRSVITWGKVATCHPPLGFQEAPLLLGDADHPVRPSVDGELGAPCWRRPPRGRRGPGPSRTHRDGTGDRPNRPGSCAEGRRGGRVRSPTRQPTRTRTGRHRRAARARRVRSPTSSAAQNLNPRLAEHPRVPAFLAEVLLVPERVEDHAMPPGQQAKQCDNRASPPLWLGLGSSGVATRSLRGRSVPPLSFRGTRGSPWLPGLEKCSVVIPSPKSDELFS